MPDLNWVAERGYGKCRTTRREKCLPRESLGETSVFLEIAFSSLKAPPIIRKYVRARKGLNHTERGRGIIHSGTPTYYSKTLPLDSSSLPHKNAYIRITRIDRERMQ